MYDDEYYCPNCGAILNEQDGFDPDCGAWTCSSCGKLLMDDDTYSGDTFEGVAWFCDNCGDLLNKQSGFSDSYGSWRCTMCGHNNGTTEDDIIDDKLTCPNCGDVLEEQFLFNKYSDDWTCASCKKRLHHDYSDEEYEVCDEEESNDDDYSDEDDDESEYEMGESNKSSSEINKQVNESVNRNVTSSESETSWKWLLVWFLVLLAIPGGILLKTEITEWLAIRDGKINAGYYEDLVGEKYEAVEAHFKSAGFTNITLIDLDDSGIFFWNSEKVEMISIAGNNTFDSDDWFYPDDEIVITYH